MAWSDGVFLTDCCLQVLDLWKRLVRGLVIKQRLNTKYNKV